MDRNGETPRKKKGKSNPAGQKNDAQHRMHHAGFVDLVGSLGWKGTGIIILIMLLGYITYCLFLR